MTKIFSYQQILVKFFLSFLLLMGLVVLVQAWQDWASLISFAGAFSLGVALLFCDEQFFYKLYADKVTMAVDLPKNANLLASRNSLFILLLPFLSIFVVTSSGSMIGTALILAINCYLLVEMWQLRQQTAIFKERFLSGIKMQLTPALTKKICYLALVYFLFLLLIIFV